MKIKLLSALLTSAILLQGAVAARGQEVAKSTASIADLKEQLAKLIKIERDEAVPEEVKNLNRNFLEERRTQLRVMLEKRISALRNYRATVGSALTSEEIRVVENSIRELETDLQGLQPETPPPATASSATRESTTRVSLATLSPSAELIHTSTPASAPVAHAESNARTEFAAPAPALAPAPQDLVPKGSDPNEDSLIRKDIRLELASFSGEILGATATGGKTLAQARVEAFDITANPKLFALLLTNGILPREQFVKDIEAARIDKQVGGSGANSGSTTLVSKGGTPAVLGFAVENGGLTREIDGTTVTFRGNLVGLVESFQKTGFIPSYNDDAQSTRLLRKLSFSLSFDTSRGDMPGTLLANRQQLSSYSFRYEFKNDRDPRNEKYKKRWETLVGNHAQNVANNIGKIQRFLDTHPAYVAWRQAAQDAVTKATQRGDSNADLQDLITTQFEGFQAIEIPPELAALVEQFQTEFAAYRQDRAELLDLVANAPIFTVEYINDRRPGLIDTSTLNFIAETGLFEGKADLTYNGSMTFFNSNPGPGMKRLRNFDHSLRFDVPIGDMRRFGAFLTFAGNYKRLTEDEMTMTGMMMPIKGDVATGQLQLTIPIRNTGFKIPLSFSFANRTEFVKEKEVRGNFGFTFDLDSVLQQFKPF